MYLKPIPTHKSHAALGKQLTPELAMYLTPIPAHKSHAALGKGMFRQISWVSRVGSAGPAATGRRALAGDAASDDVASDRCAMARAAEPSGDYISCFKECCLGDRGNTDITVSVEN